MKVEDLKFPLMVRLNDTNTTYRVAVGDVGLDWTVVYDDGKDGYTYFNSVDAGRLVQKLNEGSCTIVKDQKQAGQISIDIDASKVSEALTLAKELEATLNRIKTLL